MSIRMTVAAMFLCVTTLPALAEGLDGSSAPPFARPFFLAEAGEVHPSAVAPVAGQTNADDISEKLANPIANMISVPFQFNYDHNTGPGNNGERLTMNFQPVVPIELSPDLNLIVRTIVPVVYQDDILLDGGFSQFGMGDIQQSLFFAPTKSPIKDVMLGFGPIFLWPTATNDSLGTEKWGAGPSFVGLYQKNPWTIGLLANHIWSYAGESDRSNINQTFLQPFVTYQLGDGWSVLAQFESTYEWNDSQWTIPFSAGVSKVTHLGKLPVSLGLQGRYWLEGPDGAPEWGVRAIVTFVLPK